MYPTQSRIIGIDFSKDEKDKFLELLGDEEIIFVDSNKNKYIDEVTEKDFHIIIIPWRTWKKLSLNGKNGKFLHIKNIDSSFLGKHDILSECVVLVSSDLLDRDDEFKKIIETSKGLNDFISKLTQENELFRELYFRKSKHLEFMDNFFKTISPISAVESLLKEAFKVIKDYFYIEDICVVLHREDGKIYAYKTYIKDKLWEDYIKKHLKIPINTLNIKTILPSYSLSKSNEVVNLSPSQADIKVFVALKDNLLGEDEFSVLEMAMEHMAILLEKAFEYEKMKSVAYIDFLTHTGNRHYFDMIIKQEVKRHNRLGSKFSVIMVDIDHFKEINDTYGHLVGDMVLNQLAGIIKKNVREIDHVIRYGGEEFLIILPHTDKKSGYLLADRLRKIIERYEFDMGNGEKLKVSVSMGVSEYDPRTGNDLDLVIKKADNALYRAKEMGRNRVCVD